MPLVRAVSIALLLSSGLAVEDETCAAEGGCEEVGLAQLRRAEVKLGSESKCSRGCEPSLGQMCPNPSGGAEFACPASKCCDDAGPTPTPPSPAPPSPAPPSPPGPSGTCSVGCTYADPPTQFCANPNGGAEAACPKSGCCDDAYGPAPTSAPTDSPTPPPGTMCGRFADYCEANEECIMYEHDGTCVDKACAEKVACQPQEGDWDGCGTCGSRVQYMMEKEGYPAQKAKEYVYYEFREDCGCLLLGSA